MKKGDKLPHVKFRVRSLGDWTDTNTDTYFKDKKVILFALPGAFTPTCSNQQLPGYEKLHNVFKEHGVDDIYCMSVNDSFVMNAWAQNQKLENVKVIPDGNGDFSDKIKNSENEIRYFLRSKMYKNKSVLSKNNKGKLIISKLFKKINSNPKKFISSKYLAKNKYRAISDFISGMTDRYAINLYNSVK